MKTKQQTIRLQAQREMKLTELSGLPYSIAKGMIKAHGFYTANIDGIDTYVTN